MRRFAVIQMTNWFTLGPPIGQVDPKSVTPWPVPSPCRYVLQWLRNSNVTIHAVQIAPSLYRGSVWKGNTLTGSSVTPPLPSPLPFCKRRDRIPHRVNPNNPAAFSVDFSSMYMYCTFQCDLGIICPSEAMFIESSGATGVRCCDGWGKS